MLSTTQLQCLAILVTLTASSMPGETARYKCLLGQEAAPRCVTSGSTPRTLWQHGIPRARPIDRNDARQEPTDSGRFTHWHQSVLLGQVWVQALRGFASVLPSLASQLLVIVIEAPDGESA